MAAVAPAAMTMAMSAGPGGSRDASAGVRVEVLTPARFEGAAKVFNDFMSRGKGGCVGLCPYSWCPMSTDDFSKLYREYPDTLSTTAVAVREADDAVVGTIRLSVYGQPRSSGDEEIHKLKPGEAYIESAAVLPAARGAGIGTRFLHWCEDVARQRGATVLTLAVVNGNPARRLYERFGFVERPEDRCESCVGAYYSACLIGLPHGRCGAAVMEKELA